MSIVATITDQVDMGGRILVEGTLTFSGNYATDGEIPSFPGLKTSKAGAAIGPTGVMNVHATAAYQFHYNPVTGKLQVFQGDNTNVAAAPGVQLPAAAYPAGLTGATTFFSAFFKKP